MSLPTLHLICNAHLDPVWQWRWEEGCAEALSTFATAAELLQEHPRLVFNHNEAVLYEWVREHDPGLFRGIQRWVAEGRWCVSGGWYLQPDANLPDTESIIRCVTVGRQFFRTHFGVCPRVAYNFDSFGHSAGLPQILRLAGYDFYIHMRPQSPDLELPADLYRWRGLDGSEVGALRIVVGLYHTERDNLRQRLEAGTALALELGRDVPVFWGLGDHGGGATRRDLEIIDAFAREETRVQVRHSTTEQLAEALRPHLGAAPRVEGELQRVFTGCYTSLSRVKRQSQASLGGLVQAEALSAASGWKHGRAFPTEAFERAWRRHLFNDFHDILPGSCVEPAEQDALRFYGEAENVVRSVRLGVAIAANEGPLRPLCVPVTVLNANPGSIEGPIEVEAMADLRPKWHGQWHFRLFRLDGTELPCQEEPPEALLPFNGWRRKVSFIDTLPHVGIRHYELRLVEGQAAPLSSRPALLEHALDPGTGMVSSLRFGGLECLAGSLLEPLVVEDLGDSWGTGCGSHRNVVGRFEPVPGAVQEIAAGPVRRITETILAWGGSRLVMQTVSYPDWPVLEFRLRIHWNEEGCRLKLAIPTRLEGARLECEVPGGAFERPTDGQEQVHRRWLTLSGAVEGRPVSLGVVNSGQNGYDAADGEVRLSVLRSAAYCHERGFALKPGPYRKHMDQGVHEVRLLVTAGEPGAVRDRITGLADRLSAPPVAYAHLPIGRGAIEGEWLRIEPGHLRLLACKVSSDGRGLVVRVQETRGVGTSGRLVLTGGAEAALALGPHEIKTLRLDRHEGWREVTLAGEEEP